MSLRRHCGQLLSRTACDMLQPLEMWATANMVASTDCPRPAPCANSEELKAAGSHPVLPDPAGV